MIDEKKKVKEERKKDKEEKIRFTYHLFFGEAQPYYTRNYAFSTTLENKIDLFNAPPFYQIIVVIIY